MGSGRSCEAVTSRAATSRAPTSTAAKSTAVASRAAKDGVARERGAVKQSGTAAQAADEKTDGSAAPAAAVVPVASGAVKSADRTIELLELLAGYSEPLTLSEIHRELSYPKSSLFVLLRTLVA